MNVKPAMLVGLGALGLLWWTSSRDEPTGQGSETSWIDDVTQTIKATLKLSVMSRVTNADVQSTQMRAFLAVIRAGEGTADANGYRRLFGGGNFGGNFEDHPRQSITRKMGGKPITSTAAGAYQFLASTWDETARLMRLPDFSPASQDRAAVGRIAARGALDDVLAGRFDDAVQKVATEWASLPGSPYGQPTISADTARRIFWTNGGAFA